MKKMLVGSTGLRHALNIQMFAAAGEKSKLEKHLEELGDNTSGGAHDAVTFSGKGLSVLDKILAPLRKKASKMEDNYDDEDDDDDMGGEDDDDALAVRKTKKNASQANGGYVEDEDEDPEDPADDDDSIIANKGQRKSKASMSSAVSKSYHFDEHRFEKNFEEFDDVLDATPALQEIASTLRKLGKSVNFSSDAVAETQQTIVVLAKAVRELLKSNAALAADIELIKKQPATSPASGFVVLNKGARGNGGGRKLSKSDIEDAMTEMMNEGLLEPRTLRGLANANSDAELSSFVNSLPNNVRERL